MSDIFDFTDDGLDKVHEETLVEAGAEYQLAIVNVIQGTDKNGDDYTMPFFEIIGQPYCKEFGDFLPKPNSEKMTEKQLNKARMKRGAFLAAFSLEKSFTKDEAQGKTGWAILGMGTDQDDQPVNKINKYVVGH
ncbi:hypothetical protein LCGC14_1824860 [marine sediment metagenome]|uniref:Uncharacterized protein n=1 Tax=marine sediment metagenome TaxID=412755 RepID=A0A0F9IXG3_9ZZZZ